MLIAALASVYQSGSAHVVEAFVLTERPAGGTLLAYQGEVGADLWAVGQRWCELVAGRWEQTVAASLAAVNAEAERRAVSSTAYHASTPNSRSGSRAVAAPHAALPARRHRQGPLHPAPGG